MKKILAILLMVVMLGFLVACDIPTSGVVEKPSNVVGDNSGATQDDSKNPTNVTIDESVLVDEAGVKITAKGFDTGSIFGPGIKLLIENNSGKDLTFQCRNVSINGYMVDATMSVNVVNGKKANDSMTLMQSDLDACGIDVIADIEFNFHIFATDGWDTYLDTKVVQIKTSLADDFEYTYDDSGDLAYQSSDMKIVVKGLSTDSSIFGPGVIVYIENNSKKNVTVQVRNVSVNGFMVDGIFSCDVAAGKRAVDSITFMESDLQKNDITEIEDIELNFHIFDADSWGDSVDTETIKITF